MKFLKDTIQLAVRFSETDAMGVVWHGNYLKFFEDAREHFGARYGMQYLDVHNKGFFTPIVKSEINHKASIYYGQEVEVQTTLEHREASKIVFHYLVKNLTTGEVAATGSTTQVFLSADKRELELLKPAFYKAWEDQQAWLENE